MLDWKVLLKENRDYRNLDNEIIFEKNDRRNSFKCDFDQICFWSSLRRLQDKAQVFPLEEGDFSRTRLTHSIEVMSVAQSLGDYLVDIIINKERKKVLDERIEPLKDRLKILQNELTNNPKNSNLNLKIEKLQNEVTAKKSFYSRDNFLRWIDLELYNSIKNIPLILQSASLIHDLGNPPFGHISETVISDWFVHNLKDPRYYKFVYSNFKIEGETLRIKTNGESMTLADKMTEEQQDDLRHFDGNAELLRIVSKLQNLSPKTIKHCVKISYPTLATTIKYPDAYVEQRHKLFPKSFSSKKRNYFLSEKDLYDDIQRNLELNGNRHPLAYLLEAADDIAYLTSDLEDALTKGLVSKDDLVRYLRMANKSDFNSLVDEKILSEIPVYSPKGANLDKILMAIDGFSQDTNVNNSNKRVCLRIKGHLIASCKEEMTCSYDNIMTSNYPYSLLERCKSSILSVVIRGILKKHVYYSPAIVAKKAEGVTAINKLLTNLIRAVISVNDDQSLENKDNEYFIYKKLISNNFLELNEIRLKSLNKKDIFYNLILLVVDYISGMTDSFALKVSKLF